MRQALTRVKIESGKGSLMLRPLLLALEHRGSTSHAIPSVQDSLSSQPASPLFEPATQPECSSKETKRKVGVDSHPEVLSPQNPFQAQFSGDRALGVAKGT